ncbi:MAG: hypothetical protein RMM58_07595 [Chloroflexota bacterium]|nr:hypothetical protein [Dehalococcoidia bacterium]MDW8253724.1 hypothetical protein [Chloroflexota bacterium]
MRPLAFLLLLMALTSSGCADWPVRLFGTNLRTVDWERALNGDPNLISAPMPNFSGISGRFIETKDGAVQGFVQTRYVTYGDISGDGREEAFLPVVREGPVGVTGILVYRPSDRGPIFVGGIGGIAMRYEVRDGALWVASAARVGWEHPCCPSGQLERVYRVENGGLKLLSETVTPRDQARLPTVLRYYQLVGERKLDDAYQLLSPGFRERQPRAAWEEAVRRQDIVSITARDEPDGRVAVEMTESDPAEPRTRQSTVVWALIWSPAAKQWLLDRAEVRDAR